MCHRVYFEYSFRHIPRKLKRINLILDINYIIHNEVYQTLYERKTIPESESIEVQNESYLKICSF